VTMLFQFTASNSDRCAYSRVSRSNCLPVTINVPLEIKEINTLDNIIFNIYVWTADIVSAMCIARWPSHTA